MTWPVLMVKEKIVLHIALSPCRHSLFPEQKEKAVAPVPAQRMACNCDMCSEPGSSCLLLPAAIVDHSHQHSRPQTCSVGPCACSLQSAVCCAPCFLLFPCLPPVLFSFPFCPWFRVPPSFFISSFPLFPSALPFLSFFSPFPFYILFITSSVLPPSYPPLPRLWPALFLLQPDTLVVTRHEAEEVSLVLWCLLLLESRV